MNTVLISNLQTLLSLVLFGIIAKWYIWPALRERHYYKALIPLLLFSAFRYLGTSFLVPNMTDGLSSEFADFAAKADLAVGIIALLGAIALRMRQSVGIALAWLYAVLGSADFLYNGARAGSLGLAESIGPLMWLITVLGPAWMITLVLLFVVLIKRPQSTAA